MYLWLEVIEKCRCRSCSLLDYNHDLYFRIMSRAHLRIMKINAFYNQAEVNFRCVIYDEKRKNCYSSTIRVFAGTVLPQILN